MKFTEVKHPRGNRFTKTYDWQLKLLSPIGKTASCGAEILTFFEYWFNVKTEERTLKANDFMKIPFDFSLDFIEQSLLHQYSRNSILKALNYLILQKLILKKKGTNGQKNSYFFNCPLINQQAKLYEEGQDFKYVQFKNEHPKTSSKMNSNQFKNEPQTSSKMNSNQFKNEPQTSSNLNYNKEYKESFKELKELSQSSERDFSLKNFFSQSLLSDWNDWKKHLKDEHKLNFSQMQEKHALKKLIELSEGDSKKAKSIISYSIEGGWKTLCIKNESQKSSAKKMPDTWDKNFHDNLKSKEQTHEYYRHLKSLGYIKKTSPVGLYFEKKAIA